MDVLKEDVCIGTRHEPKEKEMNEAKVLQNFKDSQKPKFQFDSEEQIDNFISEILPSNIYGAIGYDVKSRMKEKGYIRKSELHQMVEEAEEMYKQHMEIDGHCTKADDLKRWEENSYKSYSLIKAQSNTIQALKKSHPEFK